MSMTIPDFWKLVVESQLISPQDCQQLGANFGQIKGASERSSPKVLAQWLVSVNALSRYQAALLLAGRSGPFYYGDYKVTERIDSGRFVGNFRAIHVPTQHPVMLQFVTGPYTQDPRYWQLVVAQTQARNTAGSANLHRVFEAFDTGSFKFLVCEDLKGESLDEVLTKTGRVSPQDACCYVRLIACGLAQIHQLGQPHGDVRPANLWLEPTGNLKLLHDPSSFPVPINFAAEDPSGQLQIKADYLAPEFAQPGKLPDGLTDIYALGCTFYQLLSGQPPFAGGTLMQKLGRHAAEAIQPLDALGVPPSVTQLVAYMMAKNPTVRFQQANVVAEQMMAFVEPSKLYSLPSPQPPTQAIFEHYIQSRPPVMVAQQPAAATVAPAPATGTPVGSAVPANGAIPMGSAVAAPNAASPKPSGPAIAVATGAASTSVNSAALKKDIKNDPQKLAMIFGGIAAGIIGLLVLMNSFGSGTKETTTKPSEAEPPITKTSNLPTNTPTKTPVATPTNGGTTPTKANTPATTGSDKPTLQIVPPENKAEWEKLLWASPTTGTDVAFQYVPPGSHLYVILRPADLYGSSEGTLVTEALGPTFKTQVADWERSSGVRMSDIEQLIMTFYSNGGQFPRSAFVVRLKQSRSSDELLQGWGNPEEAKQDNATIYNGNGVTYFAPPSGEGKIFVMGQLSEIKEVIASAGGVPPMRREMEKLRKLTDNKRHLTILFAPNFLYSEMFPEEGRKMYFGDAKKVREPLEWFLHRDELQAGLLSAHFGSDFYLEMRMIGNVNKEKHQLATELRGRLEKVPPTIEDYVATLGANPYWEKVRVRFNRMIQMLYDYTRVGVDDDVATINSVLPGPAAHNLVFGGEMLLASVPGAGGGETGPTKPSGPAYANTEDLVMKHKTKLAFDAQSLEFALMDLEKDVKEGLPGLPFPFKIKILGDDLKLDGITRNMTVREFKSEGTVADVLTAMVMKTTTAPGPSSPDLKLLWVVDKDPEDPSKQIVLLTTRAKAAERKYKVPAVFVPK